MGNVRTAGARFEDHRLNSLPWTSYCLDHQNRHDEDLLPRPA
jgi:hypothetical protein